MQSCRCVIEIEVPSYEDKGTVSELITDAVVFTSAEHKIPIIINNITIEENEIT